MWDKQNFPCLLVIACDIILTKIIHKFNRIGIFFVDQLFTSFALLSVANPIKCDQLNNTVKFCLSIKTCK